MRKISWDFDKDYKALIPIPTIVFEWRHRFTIMICWIFFMVEVEFKRNKD